MLAAGEGRRFGSTKQLALIDGKSMLKFVLDNISNSICQTTLVVLGANAKVIRAELNEQVNIVENTQWQSGISSSLKIAVEYAEAHAFTHICFVLGDMVAISSFHLKQLKDVADLQPEAIIASAYQDIIAVPAIFPQPYFTHLKTLTGDTGARAIIQQHQQDVIAVPLPEAGIDVDTPDALERFTRFRSSQSQQE